MDNKMSSTIKKITKNLKHSLNSKRRIELVMLDTIIMGMTYVILLWLSMTSVNSLTINGAFSLEKFLSLYMCIMIMRFFMGIYGSIWRYANVTTYLKLMISDISGGGFYILAGRIFPVVSIGFAYSVIAIFLILLVTLANRFMYQFLYAYANRVSDTKLLKELFANEKESNHKINVAIVGAGNVGATLADELLRNPRAHYYPYCFIDNDLQKIGNGINGIRIYPEDENIVNLIKGMPIQEVVIALPDASPEERADLYNLYKQTGCKVKLYDYPLSDKAGKRLEGSKRALREMRIEDLLFRDALSINNAATREYYKDKTILVTGGGGSIGSELCRQIARLSPGKLVILDIYENNAYDIQQELICEYKDTLCLDTIIATVRDEQRLDEIFANVKPDIVFHAAAHKHVPMMERSGCEAIKNNVFGTYNVANMAEKYGVKKFLLISTDKAVNPTNIMGASKRLCEMIIQCRKDSALKSGGGTEFTAVRFGNVLGSNGSVIPLFKRQIESGGPLTLTDKRIIRYFMTIPEAVGLVLEAGAMAKSGELFVLDMGKPIRILDLAENMIRLSGLKPYEDIDIVEVGLRPGEKLYEELLMNTEHLMKTANEMIFIERSDGLSREAVDEKLAVLAKVIEPGKPGAVEDGHHDAIVAALKLVVPTYREPDEVNKKVRDYKNLDKSIGPVSTIGEVAVTRVMMEH